jgi:hypothetical protein
MICETPIDTRRLLACKHRLALLAGIGLLAIQVAFVPTASANIFKKIAKSFHKVGVQIHDSGTKLGREVSRAGNTVTHEIVKDGKVVGHAVVTGGRIVAEETVKDGKVVARENSEAGRFIVENGQVVGREVEVAGKVVGREVIKDGKVVAHAAVEGAEWVVKEGKFVLKELDANACRLVVDAIRGGKAAADSVIPELADVLDDVVKNVRLKQQELRAAGAMNRLQSAISGELRKVAHLGPELGRLSNAMKSAPRANLDSLFTSSVMCGGGGRDVVARLSAMGLKPAFPVRKARLFRNGFFIGEAHATEEKFGKEAGERFSMSYGTTGSITLWDTVGALSFALVTDYISYIGSVVSLSVGGSTTAFGAGGTVDFGFYPKANFDSFKGGGWAIGISAGFPNSVYLSGGVSASFSVPATGSIAKDFGGITVSPSLGGGVGLLPSSAPELSASWGYSWRLWNRPL